MTREILKNNLLVHFGDKEEIKEFVDTMEVFGLYLRNTEIVKKIGKEPEIFISLVNGYDSRIMTEIMKIKKRIEKEKREFQHFRTEILIDYMMSLLMKDKRRVEKVLSDIGNVGINLERKTIAKNLYLQDTSLRKLIQLSTTGIIADITARINIIKGVDDV